MSELQHFICPITGEIMTDPVISPDGVPYERSAIEEWIRRGNRTCPVTRGHISLERLRPNRALKDLIDQARREGRLNSCSSSAGGAEGGSAGGGSSAAIAEVAVVPEVRVELASGGQQVRVSVSIPDIEDVNLRPGVDLVAIVDISGSMGTEASVTDASGQTETHGLSILDLVKHSLKTVVKSLGSRDRFGLVVFSTNVRVVLELSSMDHMSQLHAISLISDLETEGQTNLWGGLEKGLSMIRDRSDPSRKAFLGLFTDGIPNIRPPRGEINMFQRISDSVPSLMLNTYGFGYNLESDLLSELANLDSGMYSFIPESSMIGTVFVNSVANMLATAATNAYLDISVTNDDRRNDVSLMSVVDGSNLGSYCQFDLGAIQFGQTREIVFGLSSPGKVEVKLSYQTGGGGVSEMVASSGVDPVNSHRPKRARMSENGSPFLVSEVRQRVVEMIYRCVNHGLSGNLTSAQREVSEMAQAIRNFGRGVGTAGVLAGILADVEGQIQIAVSRRDYFDKWGKHYLPSLARAHFLQICHNFKDPGVQGYGGHLFEKLMDASDTIFNEMPPPEPSIQLFDPQTQSYVAPNLSGLSMASYNVSDNICFAGWCTVWVPSSDNGASCRVDQLKKGSSVMLPDGSVGKVVCVVKTICDGGKAELVTFDNGLVITPWHPVKIGGEGAGRGIGGVWNFPAKLKEPSVQDCPAVYSLVLDSGHQVMINGTWVICLGHSCQDEVIRHEYFGSQKVIDDLKEMPGWDEGLITFRSGCLYKDPESGVVSKLIYNGDQ